MTTKTMEIQEKANIIFWKTFTKACIECLACLQMREKDALTYAVVKADRTRGNPI